MAKERTLESEVGGYISTVLRKHFGKGPTSVYVTIRHPFTTIHFRGFLAPMEKLQMKQGESTRILATRDLMTLDLKPEISQGLREVAGLEIKELYADWHLLKETGMIIGVVEEEATESQKTGRLILIRKPFEGRLWRQVIKPKKYRTGRTFTG